MSRRVGARPPSLSAAAYVDSFASPYAHRDTYQHMHTGERPLWVPRADVHQPVEQVGERRGVEGGRGGAGGAAAAMGCERRRPSGALIYKLLRIPHVRLGARHEGVVIN